MICSRLLFVQLGRLDGWADAAAFGANEASNRAAAKYCARCSTGVPSAGGGLGECLFSILAANEKPLLSLDALWELVLSPSSSRAAERLLG